MSLLSIANRFTELCRNGDNLTALHELYADNATSIEAAETPDMPNPMTGKDSLIGKNQWWLDNHEIHASNLSGPFLHGDSSFACYWQIDVTEKQNQRRMQLEEVGVFQVVDGKIVEERFYYTMPAM